MKRSGKVHWMVLAAMAAAVAVIALFLTGGSSPQTTGQVFMSALVRGDAKVLAENSTSSSMSQEELLKAWEKTVKDAEHYRFTYRILAASQTSNDSAAVIMHVLRNLDITSYEENFQLDLKKVDGKWKVRIEGLSREMYPFMPR